MTTPTQGEVRAWARAQGLTVNDRGRLPTAIRAAYEAAQGESQRTAPAPAAAASGGLSDLAAGLRGLLDSIDTEVRAVSSLSERIDAAVSELNGLRDEQAKRLLVLDELKGATEEASLSAFLNKAIKPRRTRVSEVVPERLQ